MTQGLLPDIFSQIPDLPRWVDARGLLLSRRGFVVDAADGCRVVCGRADRLIVPVTFDLTAEIDAIAAREITGPATILLQEVMLPSARWLLQEWQAVPATVYALDPERARDWRMPQWQTSPVSQSQLEAARHLPNALRATLLDVQSRSPVWAATVDGQLLAFAWSVTTTEAWFQVWVETVESARGRGLGRAAAMGLIVDRVLRGLRPVLRVPGTNLAGARLARRLGFEAVDLQWLLTRA
jgi:hypothetical protein